jgi:hypothetical protein
MLGYDFASNHTVATKGERNEKSTASYNSLRISAPYRGSLVRDRRELMIKNSNLKKVLSALAILVSIPILFTLIFLFYALIFNFYDWVIPWSQNAGLNPYHILRPMTLFVVLAVLAWFIFRSKLATLYKAIYTTVPVGAVLAFIAIDFNSRPVLLYSLGALFALAVLAYLFFTKKPWLYYFSVISVSVVLLMVKLLGVEV